MPELNKEAPYGDIIGHPYLRYVQAGEYFTAHGEHVPADDPRRNAERNTGAERQRAEQAKREALKEAFKEQLSKGNATTVVETKPEPAPRLLDPETMELTPAIDEFGQVDNVELEDLHWTKLRELASEHGIEYQGKAKTIALIRQAGI